jgi:hypothetical protein
MHPVNLPTNSECCGIFRRGTLGALSGPCTDLTCSGYTGPYALEHARSQGVLAVAAALLQPRECPPPAHSHMPSAAALMLQAWIASIADKLEVSMEGIALVGKGFGAKSKARSR